MSIEEKNFNIRIGTLRDSERINQRKKSIKHFIRNIMVIIVILMIVLTILAIIIDQASPNQIKRITVYVTSKDGEPAEFIYERGTEGLLLSVLNLKTGETELYRDTMWTQNTKILYFDQNIGAMYFEGKKYASWKEILQDGDKSRAKNNVSKKKIEREKDILYTNTLTIDELVWLMYHPEDYNKFNFNNMTYK